MKRKSLILIIAVLLVVIGILIWSGDTSDTDSDSQDPQTQTKVEPGDSEKVSKPADQEKEEAKAEEGKEADKSTDADAQKKAETDEKAGDDKKADATDPNEPQEQLEAVNLKDVEMKDIIPRLAEWTGKVIIPHPDVNKQKLTIYSSKKMPRKKALALIYAALQAKGFICEETDDIIYLKPIKEAKFGTVPTIPASEPLAMIENKSMIVQKFFKLNNYSPSQLRRIILPLLPEHGYISADESTNHVMVIDTVENLMRFQRIIEQLDVPEAKETVTETFTIQDGDPVEIVQLLQLFLGNEQSKKTKAPSDKDKGGGPATSVVITSADNPIILIPVPKRKWIIAKASADDMIQIKTWIEKLDEKKAAEREWSLRKIEYADVRELASQIEQMLAQAPGKLKANIMVQPLVKDRKIMIIGSAENREMIEQLIIDIDKPTEKFITEHFKLKHADPEVIKQNLDELYSESYVSSSSYGGRRSSYRRSRTRGPDDPDMVKVFAFATLNQVTVMCSEENMKGIIDQIKEWDKPIDVKKVLPLIIELKNSDPVKMTQLLTTLFTEMEQNQSRYSFYFGGRGPRDKKKIVGPLYGQLTFEAVPETRKLIVISKIPEAYEVVKELVMKLDRQEPAELPMVVKLKYADSEELCDQLNAILNEPGTRASILRKRRGLSDYSAAGGEPDSDDRNRNNNQSSSTELVPWWNTGVARAGIGQEMPISNIIGKIRFIPVYRSKAILVLSPSEYQESIRKMIEELDHPAKQVLIKAIIVEVNHDDLTSLGIQISSDPSAFGVIGENALTTLAKLTYQESYARAPGALITLETSLDPTILVDLLVKNAHARVLNQPTLWTKDNEEAEFFKGKYVPFLESTQTSAELTSLKETVKYRDVGLTLRVRPNITPENKVDMEINLIIDQVEPELLNNNIVTSKFMTTTNMIVDDGQTILISGILFQNESVIVTKVPLLGDIPLLGELFKHYDTQQTNTELLAFITPYVIDGNVADDTPLEELEKAKEKMMKIKKDFEATFSQESQE